MNKHIPNALTLLRVLAIPAFIYYSINSKLPNPQIALIIFCLASITDYLDGYIARKYNIITTFGKLMDPLADKLLVLAALIILTIPPIKYIHWTVVAIIATREIAVTILRTHYSKKNIIIPADIYGKIKTTAQLIGIISALTFYATITFYDAYPLKFLSFTRQFEPIIKTIIQIIFWILAIITILSGLHYFKPKNKQIKTRGRLSPP